MFESEDYRDAYTIMQDVFSNKKYLLIFDNVETADIRNLLPPSNNCMIIITTRDLTLPNQIDIPKENIIKLKKLTKEESISILSADISLIKIQNEKESINKILKKIDYLPLAVEIVSKTLSNRIKFDAEFKISDYEKAINLDSLRLKKDSHFNIRLCFSRSITYLIEDNNDALVEFFSMMSVCAESGFSFKTAKATMGLEDDYKTKEILFELLSLCLINKIENNTDRYIFHPLLQEFAFELATQRNLINKSKENHLEYFTEIIKERKYENVMENIDDIFIDVDWIIQTKNKKAKDFWMNIKKFFDYYGFWNNAIIIIKKFEDLAIEQNDFDEYYYLAITESKYLKNLGLYSESHRILDDLNKEINKIDSITNKEYFNSMILASRGNLYQKQGQYKKAVLYFDRSKKISENNKNIKNIGYILNSLGGAYQRQGKYKEALDCFKKSIDIADKQGKKNQIARVLNSMGSVYQLQGNYKEALDCFQKSLALRKNDEIGKSMDLNSLGVVYRKQGKYKDALDCFDRSMKISERIENTHHSAFILNSKGALYQEMGDYKKAIDCFENSLELSYETENLKHISMVLNSIGVLYQKLDDYKKALQCFQASLKALGNNEDDKQVLQVLNSMGVVYRKQGKYKEALNVLKKGIIISRRIDNKKNLAILYNSLGTVYRSNEDYKEALDSFDKSIDIFAEMDDGKRAINCLEFNG